MSRALLAALLLGMAGSAVASEGHALPYKFEPDAKPASLQRGARNYMNYCSGCHSMRNLRYSRVARDLEIPEGLLKTNLMFTSDKVGDPIHASMPAESAKWFGQQPPDLTVETRKRGADWVYNYLMTFYLDDTRPTGVNNLVLPGASMPHVLWELQGWQVKPAKHEAEGAAEGEGHGKHGAGLELAQPGKLSAEDYKKFVADTVNFMAYAAEPGRSHRISIGIGVILFMLVLTVLAYLLKREYWSDVH
ncbi:MAG TPA: cytochrome c1 [Solimonas sp.]|nr:cytochrome c1 [Solimonas sp.]